MKWIKKFETFDSSLVLPLISKSNLTLFYHCDDCDVLWKVLDIEASSCKFCGGSSVEELSKDEWHETISNRSDEKDIDISNIKTDNKEFLDLYNSKKGNNYVN